VSSNGTAAVHFVSALLAALLLAGRWIAAVHFVSRKRVKRSGNRPRTGVSYMQEAATAASALPWIWHFSAVAVSMCIGARACPEIICWAGMACVATLVRLRGEQ
jgi:hypothetical protein